jgi:secondary thiamine-phosphate synthase enzyme
MGGKMKVYHGTIELQSNGLNPTYHDVTKKVREIVSNSDVKNGICVVYSQHTTCSIIFQECSHDHNLWGTEYLQQDLNNIMEKIVPTCRTEGQYLHPGPKHLEFSTKTVGEDGKYSLNTDAHLRSVFFGRSESFVINDGNLQFGEFGYVYFIDWDQTRARKRICQVQIIGE